MEPLEQNIETQICFDFPEQQKIMNLTISNNCNGCQDRRREGIVQINNSSRHYFRPLRLLNTMGFQSYILCFILLLSLFINGIDAGT